MGAYLISILTLIVLTTAYTDFLGYGVPGRSNEVVCLKELAMFFKLLVCATKLAIDVVQFRQIKRSPGRVYRDGTIGQAKY